MKDVIVHSGDVYWNRDKQLEGNEVKCTLCGKGRLEFQDLLPNPNYNKAIHLGKTKQVSNTSVEAG